MRLLNTQSFAFRWCPEEQKPPYAILSHTWDGEEISYADLAPYESLEDFPQSIKLKKAFQKIKRSAEVACDDGLQYIWIDSCCIDKKSSAELDEAIRSMYEWYRNADVCYIYLQDFVWSPIIDDTDKTVDSTDKSGLSGGNTPPTGDPERWGPRLSRCRWFFRGWTLQELVASKTREFFDKSWVRFSDLVDQRELRHVIETTTGIPIDVLLGLRRLSSINIATRMRWAAGRRTTRGEDMAYSLLGILGVQMPLLYGEGRKNAFIRLQREIVRSSTDETIFAWNSGRSSPQGLFAESPDWFIDCGDMKDMYARSTSPWFLTNKGFQVSLHMDQDPSERKSTVGKFQRVYLTCTQRGTGRLCPTFKLVHLGDEKYARIGDLEMAPFITQLTRTAVFVPQEPSDVIDANVPRIKFKTAGIATEFDCGPLQPNPQSWDWDISDRQYLCTAPLATAEAYMSGVELKYRKPPSNSAGSRFCVVGVRILWNQTQSTWECLCSVGQARASLPKFIESKDPVSETTNVFDLLWHDGFATEVKMKKGHPWYHEGPIEVTITVEKLEMDHSLRKKLRERDEQLERLKTKSSAENPSRRLSARRGSVSSPRVPLVLPDDGDIELFGADDDQVRRFLEINKERRGNMLPEASAMGSSMQRSRATSPRRIPRDKLQ